MADIRFEEDEKGGLARMKQNEEDKTRPLLKKLVENKPITD